MFAHVVPNRPLKVLVIFGMLISLGFICYFFFPHLLGLYDEMQGARMLRQTYEFSSPEGSSIFTCDPLSSSDELKKEVVTQAVDRLQQAVQYGGAGGYPYLLLGRAYCLLGQTDQAVESYSAYVERQPQNPLGHLELGFTYDRNGSKNLSVEEWKQAGSLANDFFARGNQLFQIRQYTEAATWFRRAEQMGKSHAVCYQLLSTGLALVEEGAFEKAVATFSEAAETHPVCASSPYYEAGVVKQDKMNNWSDAQVYYEKAIGSDSFLTGFDKADTYFRLGVIEKYQNKNDRKAMEEFRIAVNSNPGMYGAMIELGSSYWKLDQNYQKAEDLLKQAVLANPKGKYAYIALGDLYFDMGKFRDSIAEYKKAAEIDPGDFTISERQRKAEAELTYPTP